MKNNGAVTGNVVSFGENDDLITTTNLKGAITYFNDSFQDISGFSSEELLNKNHNLVRHPDMPPGAFNDLWTTLQSQKSWMGVVKNRSKNGDHYYVDAYVTPIKNNGMVTEYQSVRSTPKKSFIDRAENLYKRINKGKSPILFWQRLGIESKLMAGFISVISFLLVFITSTSPLSFNQLVIYLAIGLAMSLGITKIIAAPLVKLASETREFIDNDLARQVYGGSQSEVAQLRLALHMRKLESNSVVARIDDSSSQLSEIIHRVAKMSSETSNGVAVQLSEIEQLATAMNEVTASVQGVVVNTSLASDAAKSAGEVATKVKLDMENTVQSISQVANDVNQASSVIKDLHEKSETIDTVLNVIRGIADQTNLLALNAAIEAARAGENGRGFAVVADEVRSLAKCTQDSTEQIRSIIESIQSGTKDAVEAMKIGENHAEDSVEKANRGMLSLKEVVVLVNNISDMNIQIATAAEEQSSVSEEINRNVINISDEAQKNSSNTQQTQIEINQLEEFSKFLLTLVSQFKV